jgi:hypothetical protein
MVGRAVRIEQIIRHQLQTIETSLHLRPGVLGVEFLTFTRFGKMLEPNFTHPALTPRRLGNTRLSTVWHSLGVGLVAFWLLLLLLFVTALANGYMTPSPVTVVMSACGW